MPAAPFQVRPARDGDRDPLAELFAAVAEERDGIATEPPVDLDTRAESWQLESIFVATSADEVIGSSTSIQAGPDTATSRWPSRATGAAAASALHVRDGIASARYRGCHKLCLSVFARNTAAIALYRKLGFVEEGHRGKQFRRQSGGLWDSVEMGLLL